MRMRWGIFFSLVVILGIWISFSEFSSSEHKGDEPEQKALISSVMPVAETSSSTKRFPSGQQPKPSLSNAFSGRELPRLDSRIKPFKLELKNQKLESASWLTGTSWKVLLDMTAIRKKNINPEQQVLGEVGGYYLTSVESRLDAREFMPSQPLIVFDSRLKAVGVVTGVVRVVLKEGVSSEFLSSFSNARIRDAFPELRTYFVTATEAPFDLEKLLTEMRIDPSVQEAHLEILSQNYDKN